MDKPTLKDTGSFHFQHLPTSGVGVSYSPANADLPDYPWDVRILDSKVVHTTSGGKSWIYKRYQKYRIHLHFDAVSEGCAATMGSLALAGTNFRFQVIDGASVEHVGTYFWSGEEWNPPAEGSDGLYSFVFPMEEIE